MCEPLKALLFKPHLQGLSWKTILELQSSFVPFTAAAIGSTRARAFCDSVKVLFSSHREKGGIMPLDRALLLLLWAECTGMTPPTTFSPLEILTSLFSSCAAYAKQDFTELSDFQWGRFSEEVKETLRYFHLSTPYALEIVGVADLLWFLPPTDYVIGAPHLALVACEARAVFAEWHLGTFHEFCSRVSPLSDCKEIIFFCWHDHFLTFSFC